MAISRISGNILQDNLQRGANLSIQGNLIYFDVDNNRVGVLTSTPADNFTVIGVANASNVRITSAIANGVFYASPDQLAITNSGFVYDGTDVTVTANLTAGNIISTGAVIGNVTIGGNLTVANLTVTDYFSGNIISVTGNITGDNIIANGSVIGNEASITGNVTSGNVLVNNNVVALGNITGNNIVANLAISAGTTIDAVGNITGGNLIANGDLQSQTATVSGNLSSGNISVAGEISAGGNITGNNLIANAGIYGVTANLTGNFYTTGDATANNFIATGNITATGNIQGGNIISDGAVIGNVDISGNLVVANITVQEYFIGNIVNISNTVSVVGNIVGGNLISNADISGVTLNITANAAVGNILTDGYYYANGSPVDFQQPAGANTEIQYNFNSDFGASANLTYDQATNIFQVGYGNSGTIQTDIVTVTGNITGANVQVTSLTANRVVYVGDNNDLVDSANFSFDGTNANIQGQLIVDDFTIDGTNITSSANISVVSNADVAIDTANNGNIIFTIDGTGIARFVSTTSLTIPTGNTAQRPGTPETGAIRFNTAITQVEVWDGAQWEVVGSDFVSITNQVINGDGSTDTFVLDESTTEAAIIVATNGVVQQPGVAYTVTGNSITFAEAPQISDTVDIRFTAAVTYVNAITNLSGNAEITVTTQGVANIATCDSLQLPSYTVADAANIATPSAGQIIYVTNGDSGNPCLAVYSAGAWKRVSLGANIST